MKIFKRLRKRVGRALLFMACGWPALALASDDGSTSLPWDGPLKVIKDDLTGTTATIVAIIAVVLCGFSLMWGDLQGAARKAAKIGLGVSVAFGTATIMTNVFGHGALI